jgi:hypothetical protein
VQLEELEDVAARVATEAVEEALVGRHGERRSLLRMERTQPLVAGSGPLQRDVLLHHLQNVRLQPQVFDELLRK